MTLTSGDLENVSNEFVVPKLVGIDTLYVSICEVFTKIRLLVQWRPSWIFPRSLKNKVAMVRFRWGFMCELLGREQTDL